MPSCIYFGAGERKGDLLLLMCSVDASLTLVKGYCQAMVLTMEQTGIW